MPSLPAASSPIDWPRFAELIRAGRRFLLTTHLRPDCDAVGSQLAMATILESLGKEVRLINAFELPPNLRFLDPAGRLESLGGDRAGEWIKSIDVLMILDTTAWAQLGDMGEVIRTTPAKKMVVDHHVSGDDLGAELFKDSTAEATGRLVIEAADHLGVEMIEEIATAAFAALATDTGWFRFASTTGKTYRLAARLTDAGAKPDQIYKALYENETLARLQLVGLVMRRVETELEGRLIHTWIERADFESTGALASDSEDMINMTLAVGGTQVAVIFVELAGGGVKVSFRSRCSLDCAEVARQFGGGGHRQAAGALIHEPLAAARVKVLDGVRAAMR